MADEVIEISKEDVVRLRAVMNGLAVMTKSSEMALKSAAANCHPVVFGVLNKIIMLHNSQVKAVEEFAALIEGLTDAFSEQDAKRGKKFFINLGGDLQ